MLTVSRFAKSSLIVLVTATLTTAAYARGGGHAGANGSSGSHIQVHSDARIVAGHGSKTPSKGPAYWCGPHHHNCINPPVVHIPTAPQGAAQ